MRLTLILLGLVLVALGVWVALGDANYTQTETLVQFGSAKLTAAHTKVVPVWIGIAGIAAGVLAALVGWRKC
ncbi:MAG: hypothetical protein EPN56_05130 [Rhodanobacter sp.]|nr:MAG: hypothetical protein EPN78_01685 [Rhodanobacter sp.]TAM15169.1 MAG: hypothetical protein EPN66_01055 [Rhodanobacter sp.]TAM36361.1 MAG: hypothetical protein EPN56_05130 [Rhodanobacter sp.]